MTANMTAGITAWMRALVLALAAAVSLSGPAQAQPDDQVQHAPQHFHVEGAGGVPLAVTIAGNPDGPEILFLHGLGHGRSSFQPQFDSDLAADYKLVAFDLRGHGQSGKPWTEEAYADAATWAADVLAVMTAAKLTRPVLVGWSYGGLVAADFIRETGPERIAGLVLVSSLAGMVDYTPDYSRGGAEMAQAYRLLAQPSLDNQAAAIDIITPFLFARPADPAWQDHARQLGLMLPPYVRPLLSARAIHNTDLIARLTLPVLVLHGAQDAAIPPSAVAAFVAAAPQARAHRFEALGHSPFAEEPAAFNAQLRAFIASLGRTSP